ncbi:MAG: hypothetical protein HC915_03220 [Anaerolineae bacterium]|nr:hypothetical protein [Anaerolineae bacterium]
MPDDLLSARPLHSHLKTAALLFVLLCGMYWLTYRGAPQSIDELALLSGTESFTKAGNFENLSTFNYYKGLHSALHEPLQMILASPLYALALRWEPVGILHLVWTFNIFITALIGTVFYLGAVSLGYSRPTSLVATLSLGLASTLWPYSQTFFREPLTALWLLVAMLLALHLGRAWRWPLVLGLVVAYIAALSTKTASLAVLPALLLALLPANLSQVRNLRWGLAGVAILSLSVLFLLNLLADLNSFDQRFSLHIYLNRIQGSDGNYFLNVLAAYLISPGRSLWTTSPSLLLGLYGAALLLQNRAYRAALLPLLAYGLLAAAYGLSGREWHGGRGWASRYMLPVLPIVGLLLLPAWEQVLRSNHAARFAAGMLLGGGVMLQLGGLLVPLDTFYGEVSQRFPERALEAFYDEAVWQPQHTQWLIHLQHLRLDDQEIAWGVAEPGAWGYLAGAGLTLASAALLWWQDRAGRAASGLVLPLLGATPILMLATLLTLQRDPRLLGQRDDLHQLLAELKMREGQNELVLLSTPELNHFFFNYYKSANRWVTLPHAIGERYSPEQVPIVPTDVPDDRLNFETRDNIDRLALRFAGLWQVETLSPFQWWTYRPVEHYLVRHFYPLESLEIHPTLRLLHFSPQRAPVMEYVIAQETRASRWELVGGWTQELSPPYNFGPGLELRAYQMPNEVERGAVLPVALNWGIPLQASIPTDYNVGVYVFNADGQQVLSRDGPLQGGFGNPVTWVRDVPLLDNHGLRLPAQLPPGEYEVRVVLYDWRDLVHLNVRQGERLLPGDYAPLARFQLR